MRKFDLSQMFKIQSKFVCFLYKTPEGGVEDRNSNKEYVSVMYAGFIYRERDTHGKGILTVNFRTF
jgi:hypothetical protein